ncbi:MAG: type II toxin-antitoxin system HicB family antitoxin, partial [Mesorhizobium sp.]
MRHYIGLIHKEADSDFGVSFPDFPDVRVNVTMPEDVL